MSLVERLTTDFKNIKIPSEKTLKILFSALAVVVVVFFLLLCMFYPRSRNFSIESTQLYRYQMLIYMAASLVFLLSLAFYFMFNCKIELKFTVIFALTGLIYSFIITPYSGPDEMHHWKQSYLVSNAMLLKPNIIEVDYSDYYIEGIAGHHNVATGYLNNINNLFRTKTEDEILNARDVFVTVEVFDYPVARIPPAIGMSLARLLTFNSTTLYFFGRLFNLAFTVILLYMTLKIIPKFKIVVFVIAMLPMFLQLASSLSYDPFVNALSLLLLALILKQVYSDEKMKRKDYLIIFIVSILVSTTKAVYFPLTFFIFCIPIDRFKNKKDFWIKTLTLVIISIIASMGYYIMRLGINGSLYGLADSGTENYSFVEVISNPFRTIKVFLNTIGDFYRYLFDTLVGTELSGLTLLTNRLLIFGFKFVLLLLCFKKKDGDDIAEPTVRLTSAVACISIFVLVLLSMMISWTPRESHIIIGLQGRYFFPIVLPVIMMLRSSLVTISRDTDKFVLCATSFFGTLVIFNILTITIGVLSR